MTCQELVELVTEYLEGTLAARERALFDDHLAICPGCRTYVEQIRRTIQALGRMRENDLPEQAREELLDLFRDWNK